MRAAVLTEVNKPLQILDLEQEGPKAGEVRVQVKAAGVCMSDWHVMNGDWPLPLPMVLGHEAASSVLVVGCGGVGLNVVQGAKLAGAKTIIACDLLDNKLGYAREFGATHTINAGNEDVVKRVQELTDGFGADYAFDAIGGEKTAVLVLDAVAAGG